MSRRRPLPLLNNLMATIDIMLKQPDADIVYGRKLLPGKRTSDGKFATLYIALLTHILLLGQSGNGKSSTILRFIRDCLKQDLGFIIIDFHGLLARDAYALCASHGVKPEDVIVVSPHFSEELAAAVKVNPLDINPSDVNMVVDLIKSVSINWGDRLDTVLRNAILSVINLGKQYRTFSGLYNWVASSERRSFGIPKLTDEELKEYWNVTFMEQYGSRPEEASGPVINKLSRVRANFYARATFDISPNDRTLDFVDIIRNNKRVIIDLGGVDNSSKTFIGSIITMLIYSARNQLQERLESAKRADIKPFFLMIDEVQLLHDRIREFLNEYRKYNIKMVIATQAADGLGDSVVDAIMEITSTIIAFAVGGATYKIIEDRMNLDKKRMANLEPYKFVMYTKQVRPGSPMSDIGIFSTEPVKYRPEYDTATQEGIARAYEWAKQSVKAHGSPVLVEKFLPPSADQLNRVELPVEDWKQYAVMCWMFSNGGTVPMSTVYSTLAKTFNSDIDLFRVAIDKLLRRKGGYWLSQTLDSEQGPMLSLTNMAADELFIGDVPRGPRGGGDWHISVIRRIAMAYREQFNAAVIDTGGGNAQKPDVLVIPYSGVTKRDRESGEEQVVDILWNYDAAMAFEVESNPIGNPDQVYENYRKNERMRYQVNYVIDSEKERGDVYTILQKRGIPTDSFRVWLVNELPEAKYYGYGLTKSAEETPTLPPPVQNSVQAPPEIRHEVPAGQLVARLKLNGNDEEAKKLLVERGYTINVNGDKMRIKKYETKEDYRFRVRRTE